MSEQIAMDVGNWVGNFATVERVKNFRLHFLGGEPFLNLEAVHTIIDTIDNNYSIPSSPDGRYVVFTNGDFLTKENLTALKNKGVLIYLHCLNDISLAELEWRINLVRDICHGCAVSIVIDDSPIDRFLEIIKLAIKYRCHPRLSALYLFRPTKPYKRDWEVYTKLPDNYISIYRDKVVSALRLILDSGIAIYPNFIQSDIYITWDKIGINPHFCGRCFYVIDSVGNIRSCSMLHTEIGSIYEHRKASDLSFIQKHVAIEDCRDCEWVTWCQSGCPARRTANEKIYLCDVYKKTFPMMMELKDRWLHRNKKVD